jgi:hypothetical protein
MSPAVVCGILLFSFAILYITFKIMQEGGFSILAKLAVISREAEWFFFGVSDFLFLKERLTSNRRTH